MNERLAIQACGLSKFYSGTCAVNGIDLAIPRGALFGILGPNGAGKSTTLRMIQGITPPDAGTLRVLGFAVPAAAAQMRRHLGMVPQIDNLDPDFTVVENLRTYGKYFSLDKKTIDRRVAELIEFVELQGHEQASIHALSGGMKRRLTFARALMNDPDLIMLDEPTTGLDPQVRHQIWDKLRELKQRGKTIVLTTHYLEEAQRLCDELVVIDHGEILQQGKPRDLIRDHVEAEVIEVHSDDRADAIFEAASDCRIEKAGGTVYAYLQNAEAVTHQLHEQGIAYLQRPANLEDVFLKLTGRGLRI